MVSTTWSRCSSVKSARTSSQITRNARIVRTDSVFPVYHSGKMAQNVHAADMTSSRVTNAFLTSIFWIPCNSSVWVNSHVAWISHTWKSHFTITPSEWTHVHLKEIALPLNHDTLIPSWITSCLSATVGNLSARSARWTYTKNTRLEVSSSAILFLVMATIVLVTTSDNLICHSNKKSNANLKN